MPEHLLNPEGRQELTAVYEDAKSIGLLGPSPVEHHIDHGMNFVQSIDPSARHLLDLGSGAGVPGLLIGLVFPRVEIVLLDAMAKRCKFLEEAIARLKMQSRAAVLEGRAETLAREPYLRGHFDVVTARSFASPAVTAECAVGFLRPGGDLLVSEPPDEHDRWPAEGLAELNLTRNSAQGASVAHFSVGEAPERYPRRVGIPAKRPLF